MGKDRQFSALVDTRVLAYRTGGIQRYMSTLTRWMPKVADEIELIVGIGERHRYRNSGNTPFRRLITPPHHRMEHLTLGLEINRIAPDICHFPDFIAPRFLRMPSVITVHDIAFLRYPDFIDKASFQYYGQIWRSVRTASRIIVVSSWTAEQLTKLINFDADKLRIVPNGVEPSSLPANREMMFQALRLQVTDTQANHLTRNRPIILAVGTIEPRKRYPLLLDVIETLRLQNQAIDPVLVIVGSDGWKSNETIRRIKILEEAGAVIWLSNLDDEGLAHIFRLATVLVQASLDEGFGLPVIEAMMHGLPVIASNRGALPEITGDAGMIVHDDSHDSWVGIIHSVLARPEIQARLKHAGFKRASMYTAKEMAIKTAQVYREARFE